MRKILILLMLLTMSSGVFAKNTNGPNKYRSIVEHNAYLWNLPPEMIMGVIYVESRFNPNAISNRGAVGLMQVVPHSGGREIWNKLYGKDHTPSVSLLKTPDANVILGSAYLAHIYHDLMKKIADKNIRAIASLAAYNCGPGCVGKILKKHGIPKTTNAMYQLLSRYSPQETHQYVISVVKKSIQYARDDIQRSRRSYAKQTYLSRN